MFLGDFDLFGENCATILIVIKGKKMKNERFFIGELKEDKFYVSM